MPEEPVRGVVDAIHISDGGVPKHPVPRAFVSVSGVAGDRQHDLKHHGGPERALCLYAVELIEALQREGHGIAPGCAGENLMLRGVSWSGMVPGACVRIGAVEAEITDYTSPCANLIPYFMQGDFSRISQKLHPGWSRVYARVTRAGEIAVGDAVVVGTRRLVE